MASLTSHPAQHAARLPALAFLLVALHAFLLVALTRNAAGAEPPNKSGTPHEKPGHPTENRLAKETSPYLLMHATNPVDWYPWGEEALERAQREKKLIFLSIGYSSCYWCHVMERESFMDEEIAKMLNEKFVCIKVDREERPDVDEIYMTSLQIYFRLVGSPRGGGWPLSMFLTPDAEPVLGGTYFPPREKPGRPGFLQVLRQIHDAWEKEPQKFLTQGQAVARLVRENLQAQDAGPVPPLDSKPVEAALAQLSEQYDAPFGGFGYSEANPQSPKFPEPSNLVYLLDQAGAGHEAAGKMLIGTLESMARGGIRDHLGGGFHRYSTDRYWRVPHFEKMLYDNGQLASVYARAYAMTGQKEFRRVVEQLVEFVLREMTDPAGGFYSALDAETDAVEGKYYVWTRDELGESLPADDLALLAELYGTGGEANFEEHYVLLLDRPLAARAEARGMSEAELVDRWEPLRQTLLKLRDQRKRPLTDTKILTAWNGLMIRGLADAGRLLKQPAYVEAATRAARFVLDKLKTPDGRLLRSFAGGNAKLNGYLDDYAFLVDGLIALHEATGNDAWLEAADRLTAKQIELFWDDKAGGFYFTSHDHEKLFARGKKPTDGALPSGNSVSADNLIYLAAALERPDYRQRAEQTIQAALPLLTRAPTAAPRMAAALAAFLESKPAP